MLVPDPPVVEKIERISPTLYDAAIRCVARAAWLAGGDRKVLPAHPRALLGIAVHAVLERARTGRVAGSTAEERRECAERYFDQRMREIFASAHPLLRVKFGDPDRLPFYNLLRARAVRIAMDFAIDAAQVSESTALSVEPGVRTAEAALVSRDGYIAGRADVVDAASATVIDYKTGSADEVGSISDSELRQLRLYAYLAGENGVVVRRGVIERTNRTRVEVSISPAEAVAEGRRALAVMQSYNQHAGKAFESQASPSPEACRYCPCIPLCEPFWRTAKPDWSGQCGTHVEGVVEAVDGDSLVSIYLKKTRGTSASGQAVVTRLSRDWLTLPDSDVPRVHDTVRAVNVASTEEAGEMAVFRADRTHTALWVVPTKPELEACPTT